MRRVCLLVLSRKQGDIIKIGDDIEVKIIQIKGRNIRLGVTAKASLEISSVASCQSSVDHLSKGKEEIDKSERGYDGKGS